MPGLGHSVHSASKSQLVRFGGPGEAAQLSDELERRCADLFVRGRRFEVMQGFDVSTHEDSSSPPNVRDPVWANWRGSCALSRDVTARTRSGIASSGDAPGLFQ